MNYDLKKYYLLKSGNIIGDNNVWYANADMNYAFRVYGDNDTIFDDKITIHPSIQEKIDDNIFSSKTGQIFDKTKIIESSNGERVELDLEKRIVTFVVDQSGSMTWNDNEGVRYDIIDGLVDKMSDNYGGEVVYNIVEYGGKKINVILFGVMEENLERFDYRTISELIGASDDSYFSGIRVVRKKDGYASSYAGIDGDILKDGFFSGITDTNLEEGEEYFYTVYTYDKDQKKFSNGINIKSSPKVRDIPRGISIFRTIVDTDEIGKGTPLIGKGVNRDENTIGIWHLDEGNGRIAFDFSNNKCNLMHSKNNPYWLNRRFVSSGSSGLLFDGNHDYLYFDDVDNKLNMLDEKENGITISAWIFPYKISGKQYILSRGDEADIDYSMFLDEDKLCVNLNGTVLCSPHLSVELNKWQYVSVSYNGDDVLFKINDMSYRESIEVESINISNFLYPKLFVGCDNSNENFFQGRITEVSLHNASRDVLWIDSQINQVGDEFEGRKDDNGDRLVVFRYEIPSDFNFENGKVRIVRNIHHMPSWEEDGDIIYEEDASPGIHFVTDPDDFYIGKRYFYKIFSKNEVGNYCFSEDSYGVFIDMPTSSTDRYFLENNLDFSSDSHPDVSLISGNGKNCFLWEFQSDILKRVQIYYNSHSYPVSYNNSVSGSLIFDGWIEDNFFIHRKIENNIDCFYTIVFLDKYERVSSFINKYTVPSLDSNEDRFPMEEVKDIHYDIIDENTIGIKWDIPDKDVEDISAYFDQTIVLFGAITDEYGEPISDESPLDLSIIANINREKEVEDVFDNREIGFEDTDVYRFNVIRSKNGIVKATLRMTSNTDIISRIKEATFNIQIKSEIKKIGYDTLNGGGDNNALNPFRDYARVLEGMLSDLGGVNRTENRRNDIFSFFSKSINVKFKNPWELEIINRDNKKVYESCYYISLNRSVIPPRQQLAQKNIFYNGIHMRSSSPFVARIKVKYKGEPIDSGSIRLSAWDATMDGLCTCAHDGATLDCQWEGENIRVSETVVLQNSVLHVQRGIEINSEGVEKGMSYVDVPIYSTDRPHAINLYAKSEMAGYSSIDKIYILFQNILKINLTAPPNIIVGRKKSSELFANCFIIHPDYPDMNNESHKSKITLVKDGTVVQWFITLLEGNRDRNIYSIDNVPLVNGVYSYARNGISKNVFFESVEAENREIDESHIITASISYEGLFAESQRQVSIKHSPLDLITYNPRFLMEIDSDPLMETWTKNYVDKKENAIWADGKDYKKIKIHRNPNTDDSSIDSFFSASYFRSCSNRNGVPIFELSYGQLVRLFSSEDVEIVHGDVEEDIEHETGDKYLKINQDGFVGEGDTNIFLDKENDITYFYLRVNKFIGENERHSCPTDTENPYFCEEFINECMGIKRKESPEWTPLIGVRGEADIFVDRGPVTLNAVSSIESGWPPISVWILEPLSVETIERVVKVPMIIEGEERYVPYESYKDDFFIRDQEDNKDKNFIFYGSIIEAKIKVSWKNKSVPDNTPIYVRVGSNNERKFFISEKNIYYTETNLEEDYSFVNVVIKPRVSVSSSSGESVYIYSTYDERGDANRDQGVTYNLRLDPIEFALDIISPPPVQETDDIIETIKPPSLYLRDVNRYNIIENKWDKTASMNESRGNSFCGSINNSIFIAGGMNGENISVSATVERYDPYDNLWSYVDRSGFTPRFSGMSLSCDNKIFMIGGIERGANNNEFDLSNKMEVLSVDSSGEVWETLLPVPEEIAFGSACLATIDGNKYIYILGGVNDARISSDNQIINGYSSAIHRYDIRQNIWESFYIASNVILETYQRILPLSIFHETEILVFNGAIVESNMFFYPSNNFSITLEQDLQDTIVNLGNTHLSGFPIPKFQSSMSYYDADKSYYVFGGGNDLSTSMDIVEKIIIDNDGISYENSENDNSYSLSKIPSPIHAPVSEYIEVIEDSSLIPIPYVYVMGGYKSTFLKSDIDISIEI